MSKIFDALRKAEQEPIDLIGPPVETELREETTLPRDVRVLETEFGRLSGALQSCFTRSKGGRVILVVGAVEREGTTYVAAHLGRALAGDCGGPVLCLDADFHDRALAAQLGAKASLGLTDVYDNGGPPRELSEIIQRSETANLYLLTPGRRRINPVSFFDSTHFDALLVSMRRTFRYTIIDAPPLLARPDSIHLAARVDGVILVVRHGRLKREVLQKSTQMLESISAPLLGAVLNRRRFAIPALIYKLIS